MKRLLTRLGLAVAVLGLAPGNVLAAPSRIAVIEDVSCDNGETVDIAFVLGSNPHSVFFVLDGNAVLPLMSYVFTDSDTGEVLLAATHPIGANQPTTTCSGVDPNFDPSLGIEATFVLEVIFTPAG